MSSTEHHNPEGGTGAKKDYSLPISIAVALLVFSLLPEPDKSKEIAMALDPNGPDELALSIGGKTNFEGDASIPVTYKDGAVMIVTKTQDTQGGGKPNNQKWYEDCFTIGQDAAGMTNAAAKAYVFANTSIDNLGGKNLIDDFFWFITCYDNNGLDDEKTEQVLDNLKNRYDHTSAAQIRYRFLGLATGLFETKYGKREAKNIRNKGFPGSGDIADLVSQRQQ